MKTLFLLAIPLAMLPFSAHAADQPLAPPAFSANSGVQALRMDSAGRIMVLCDDDAGKVLSDPVKGLRVFGEGTAAIGDDGRVHAVCTWHGK